jgi:phytoene synthase
MTSEALVLARQSIAVHSKSFALASTLFPRRCRDQAAVVYALCRRWDDAIDLVAPADQPVRLETLRSELELVYEGEPRDPILRAFQEVARETGIPRHYLEELLQGMEMDVRGVSYTTLDDLLAYCWRVAGVVGTMMCHVMAVREPGALRHAAHLGIAMQLTNICRDVAEDWERGRLYVPDDVLAEAGAPRLRPTGDPFPESARGPMARALVRLLGEADRFYRSGDRGLPALSRRCGLAVRSARLIYAGIGDELARRGHDVLAGRATVPTWRKLLLLGRACLAALAELPRSFRPAPLETVVRFPHDVLPL